MHLFPSFENIVLQGPRVTLRPIEPGDYPPIAEILSNPITMEHLLFMTRQPAGWSLEDVEERYRDRMMRRQSQRCLDFAAVLRKDDEEIFLGTCGFSHVDLYNRNADFGIILDHAYWGKGFGTECRMICLEYVFDMLGLHRVQTSTLETNFRVRKFYDSLGLKPEAVRKEVYFQEDGFINDCTYVIFQEQWPSIREKLWQMLHTQVPVLVLP